MIIGINPGYLATTLKNLKFFRADPDPRLRARKLNGETGYLVWDQNCPCKKYPLISIKNINHPLKGMVNIKIKFLKIEEEKSVEQAALLIKGNRKQGYHIICGYDDHSRLVAGVKNGHYFLWDPDLTKTDISKNISGEYSLDWFYDLYKNDKEYRNKAAEYWIYSVDMKKNA